MTPAQINAMLKATRDQKFRQKTQGQIDGDNNRRAAMQELAKDAEWLNKVHISNSARSLDPNWGKNHWKDPESRKNASIGAKKRWQDPAQRQKMSEISKQHTDPVATPYGIFPSRKEAGEHLESLGISNNGGVYISTQIRRNKPGYKKLTKEEYEQLRTK